MQCMRTWQSVQPGFHVLGPQRAGDTRSQTNNPWRGSHWLAASCQSSSACHGCFIRAGMNNSRHAALCCDARALLSCSHAAHESVGGCR